MRARNFSELAPSFLLISVLLLYLLPARPAQANPQNDAASMFYQELAPYGNWVQHHTYGRVWYPNQVSKHWRPYTDGYWEYTREYGWLWVSDWVWGWAPFHYGRWVWDDWYGWVWVPGTVWAPAWVFWRYGGGYASWAPMPPQYIWNPYYGYSTHYFDYDRYVRRDCWVSVHMHDFPRRDKQRRLIAPDRNREILKATQPVNNITVVDNNIVNLGIPLKNIETATGKRFKPVSPKVLTIDNSYNGNIRPRQLNEEPIIFRPVDIKPTPEVIHKEEQIARQIAERSKLSPGISPNQSLQDSQDSEPKLPGRLSGKAMPNEYRQPRTPASVLPEISLPASPIVTQPEPAPPLPTRQGVSPKALGHEPINKPTDRIPAETEQRRKLDLERQQQAEQLRIEREAAQQQRETHRRQQLKLERQQQEEQSRMEREASQQRQQIDRRQQLELERQRQAEQLRMEQEAELQQQDSQHRQQLKLERQQQQAERLRIERDAERQQQEGQLRIRRETEQQQQEMYRRQQMELENQQAEQLRMEQEAEWQEIRRQQLYEQQQIQQPQQSYQPEYREPMRGRPHSISPKGK